MLNVVQKLPMYLQNKWRELASKARVERGKIMQFSDLADFVSMAAETANDPVYGKSGKKSSDPSPQVVKIAKPKTSSFSTTVSAESKTAVRTCILCNENHDLDSCDKFARKSIEDKRKFIMEKGLCFGCLRRNHISKLCRNRLKCQKCDKRHPTSLHVEVESSTCTATAVHSTQIFHAILPVRIHQRGQNKSVTTYAFYDNGSSGCFVTQDVMDKMAAVGVETVLQLKTMHGCNRSASVVLNNLVVTDMSGEQAVELPRTYVRDEIPVNLNQVPRPAAVRSWKHLQRIADEIPDFMENIKVGILIGSNCPIALEPLEVIPTSSDDKPSPYALRLRHGWTVHGPSSGDVRHKGEDVVSHRIVVQEIESHKEIISPSAILNFFEADFNDRKVEMYPGEKGMSQEDLRFMQIAEDGIGLQDGHYTLPLPFKNENVCLPNNRNHALKRLLQQKKKMLKDARYFADYKNFMNVLFEKGFAEEVDATENTPEGKVWFLPHHGIYSVNKPGKIRVVFDCSSSYMGKSLNDCLLQGPDLTSSLVGVLTRFRLGPVAFMADIESMFYQVHVPCEQRSFLRFLWWPEGNLDRDLREYQMTVHIFGAASSPSISNFALRTAGTASQSAQVSETVNRNFYVDDCLKAVDSVLDAKNLIKELCDTCSKGGLRLTKFTSNSKEVLQSIPREEHSKELLKRDLNCDGLPMERALGIQWNVDADQFSFSISINEKPFTRRGILSIVSSVYDPMGFVAPVTLTARQILQELCQNNKLGWDDEIPNECATKWHEWLSELPKLEQISIDRNVLPDKVNFKQLIAFSDASSTGYGAVVYLRCRDENGEFSVNFMMGKARVAPLKSTTIPRLELTAAVTAVKLAQMVKCELHEDLDILYFTDSTTVLHYITNDSKRWPIFVANRVQLIRNFSDPSSWNYVASEMNPADEASRGVTPSKMLSTSMWLQGPDFLKAEIGHQPDFCHLEQEDPESMAIEINDSEQSTDSMKTIIDYFSNWYSLKRAIAVYLKVRDILRDRIQSRKAPDKKTVSDYKLGSADIQRAEIAILKWQQWQCFPEEMKQLSAQAVSTDEDATRSWVKPTLPKSSSLHSLDPFLHQGLLRVGGRLRRARMIQTTKHPVVLPAKSHVTTLIIRSEHQVLGHAGRNHVLSSLRQKYWIIRANATVRSVIYSCVRCRRLRGPAEVQKMSDLPDCRLNDTLPPFSYSGVDYFGPFLVREGRKEVKYYGVLFTCLVSRAVHLEAAHSLDTDSFLHALRRFIARRGNIVELHSDNGTNFRGADRELREALMEMDQSKKNSSLRRLDIQWKFNPPAASHMGGIWERQVRTVRKVLAGLLLEHGSRLDFESFQTFLCEVEAIINSRPLTTVTSDPDDLDPLTPNHILQGRSHLIVPPPGIFQKEDLYLKKRWRRVQYLANVFWSRWRNEYLLLQQCRTKWTTPSRNLCVNDIVLIKDESSPRNCWPLGRIVEVEPDSNGQVRTVTVKTQNSQFRRPVNKLVLLLASN